MTTRVGPTRDPTDRTGPFSVGGAGYDAAVAADSPVAYWHLSETAQAQSAVDATGNGHAGTYTGGPGFTFSSGNPTGLTARGHCLTGTCVAFTDGTDNDYVNVPTSAAFNVTSLSCEAWVLPGALGANAMSILDRDGENFNGNVRQFQFRLTAGAAQQFIIFIGASAVTVTDPNNNNDGLWHHLVSVYDGAHVTLYRDGVQAIQTAQTGTLNTGTCPLIIANHAAFELGSGGAAYQNFNGRISRPAIYGTALSAARVAAHYNAATCSGGMWIVGRP